MRQTHEAIDAAVRDCINYCGVEADLDLSLAEYHQYLFRTCWASADIVLVMDRAERALRPIFQTPTSQLFKAG